jgi:hypothetical protein
MSVMGPDGKIHQADGSWWSPYGNSDAEIQENLKTGKMPNAPDAMRVGPKHFTGSESGDETLRDFLGSIGALGGQAKGAYEKRKKKRKGRSRRRGR